MNWVGLLSVQGIGGLAVLFVGIFMLRDGLIKLSTWPRVEGTVVDVVRITGMLTPQVEFTGADGVARRFFERLPYRSGKRVGATVRVMMDPHNVAEAETVNLASCVAAPILTALFGFSLAYCTVFACVRGT